MKEDQKKMKEDMEYQRKMKEDMKQMLGGLMGGDGKRSEIWREMFF